MRLEFHEGRLREMEREVEETAAAEEIRRRLQLREANLVKKFVFLSHVSISGVLDMYLQHGP